MARIHAALAKIADALIPDERLLARAQHRYKASRKRAFVAHNKQVKAQEKTDKLRAEDKGYLFYPIHREEGIARRQGRIAHKNHARAEYWLGRIKRLTQRIEGLEVDHKKLEAELREWKKDHGVQIHRNHATGGTPGKRWVAVFLKMAANCSKGLRRNFYSMEGAWDILHEILHGPEYGHRSDCSSTVTGGAKAADVPDPNGADWTGGWTETLMSESNGWREVNLAALEAHGWGYIVYVRSWEDKEGHHTEAFIGNGRTVGHGSAPVDFGVPDLFGDGLFRCYILDPKK